MVTIQRVKELMKKYNIDGITKVNSKTKDKYLKLVLDEIEKKEKKCEPEKIVTVDLVEETGKKCGDTYIQLEKKKKRVADKESIRESIDFEKRLKGTVAQSSKTAPQQEKRELEKIKIKLTPQKTWNNLDIKQRKKLIREIESKIEYHLDPLISNYEYPLDEQHELVVSEVMKYLSNKSC